MARDSVQDQNKHPDGTEQAIWAMRWLMVEITAHRQLMESAVKLLSTNIQGVDVSPQRSTAADHGEISTSSTATSSTPFANTEYHYEFKGTQCQKKRDDTNRGRSTAKEELSRGTTNGNKVYSRQNKPAPKIDSRRTKPTPTTSRSLSPRSDCSASPLHLKPPTPRVPALHSTSTDNGTLKVKSTPPTPHSESALTAAVNLLPTVCDPHLNSGKGTSSKPAEPAGARDSKLYHVQRSLQIGPCQIEVHGHLQSSSKSAPSGANTKPAPPKPSALLGGKSSNPHTKCQGPLTKTAPPTRPKVSGVELSICATTPPLEEVGEVPSHMTFFRHPTLQRYTPTLPPNFRFTSTSENSPFPVVCCKPLTVGAITVKAVTQQYQTNQLVRFFTTHGWEVLLHKDVDSTGLVDTTFLNVKLTPNSKLDWLTRRAILQCLLPHPHVRDDIPLDGLYGVHYSYMCESLFTLPKMRDLHLRYDIVTTKKRWLEFEDHQKHWLDPHELPIPPQWLSNPLPH
eukprot:TRINITY_DN67672_c3_g1_i5.p1 TRINITY_DN67672_c3_g1~~TRINITY_DN67672_c3_g1_i5.p1  ORF type:complete len:510 (-),score=0.64 TRINITY_DN67672_c3_g1_i5:648-2177(-)